VEPAKPNLSTVGKVYAIVMSKQEFESKSDQEVQDLFKRKHIVVHDQFEPTLSFDEKGLRTLGNLHRPVTIQGMLDLRRLCIC